MRYWSLVVVGLAAALLAGPVSAQVVIWRLGVEDGATPLAKDGAAEWRLGDGQVFVEDYDVPALGHEDPAPDLAGYQLDQRLARPDGVANDAANRLDINFTLDVPCAGAFVRYGRYGSEDSQVALIADNQTIFNRIDSGAGEETWELIESATVDLDPGVAYEVRLIYRDTSDQTGEDNGFYIDYVEALADFCGEPTR